MTKELPLTTQQQIRTIYESLRARLPADLAERLLLSSRGTAIGMRHDKGVRTLFDVGPTGRIYCLDLGNNRFPLMASEDWK